jgi:hypothetical protein
LRKHYWVFCSHVVSVVANHAALFAQLALCVVDIYLIFREFPENILALSLNALGPSGDIGTSDFSHDKQGWYIDCFRVEGRLNSTRFISGKLILRVIKRNIRKEKYE